MRELTGKEKIARKKVCLPLDGLSTIEEVRAMVEELSPVVGLFKIGKELCTRFGPEVVKLVKSCGCDVFRDLKYHDIPNTVKGAARAATELGVFVFNVHASGGLEMMRAAREGVGSSDKRPLITAVTVLTSIDKGIMNNELNISGKVEEQVLRLAKLAEKAEMDGIVCSAADLFLVKDRMPEDFIYVTPGIKGTSTPAGADQKRVFSPGNAVRAGSSILVIGRAITNAPDRVKAGLEVLEDMAEAL